MKKSLLLASAPLVALLFSASATAEPATAPVAAPSAPATAPDTREQALALLDKTAQAYAALDGLSMNFVATMTFDGHTFPHDGSIAFDKTGRSRVTPSKQSKRSLPTVTTLGAPVNSPAAKALLFTAVKRIPSVSSRLLIDLLRGENPFRESYENVRLLPGNVVAATRNVPPGYGMRGDDVLLYIDPSTHLLNRIDSIQSTYTQGGTPEKPLSKPFDSSTTFSDIRINPVFAPDAFAQPKPLPPEEPDIYWDPKIKVGATPFPISGTDLSGTPRDLDQYKGKVLLVDFWATWCGPCVRELPNVLSNRAKYGPQGFEVLSLSLDSDKKALTDFIAAHKMTWPQLFDGKEWKTEAVTRYGVKGIPFMLLIGKDGKIAAINPRGDALEPAIKAALAG